MSYSLLDEAEVVVVGGGPAGSSCAATLAEQGHDVLIVDQDPFPREKPCGDGLTPSSVAFLERLEIPVDGSHHEIAGLRVISEHQRESFRVYDQPALCVTRADLDMSLLDAACARGARFRQARVDRPLITSNGVEGIVLATPGDPLAIRARCVIAADGATSRLRREVGFGDPTKADLRAYAVRQYCRTDKALDPFFDILVPLQLDERGMAGYGWVFPLGGGMVNVGIGYFRGGGLDKPPPIRRVLESFVQELDSHEVERYGHLEPTSKPFGSPMGIGFKQEECQFRQMLFAGDAAFTTDPLTGEGIAYALHGGALVAGVAHDALSGRHGLDWHLDLRLGRQLAHRFLRLGQDIAMVSRLGVRELNRRGPVQRQASSKVYEPFLRSAKSLIVEPDQNPTFESTHVAAFLATREPELAAALPCVSSAMLDALQTNFPFSMEMLHRQARSSAGPAPAATVLLAAHACGREPDREVVALATGVQLLSLFPVYASQVIDDASRLSSKANNAFAVLVADLVVSRALRTTSAIGDQHAQALAATACSMCEGQMIDVASNRAASPSPERYFKAAALTHGSLFALAAGSGAELADAPPETVAAIRDYGHDLGIAFRIAEDLRGLTADDFGTSDEADPHGWPLPLLYANGTQGTRDSSPRDAGVATALEDCRAQVERAKTAVEQHGLEGWLVDLAELPLERAQGAEWPTAAEPVGIR
jgi:geranylgeranyl reductase family protein